jgi:hypothetical protein
MCDLLFFIERLEKKHSYLKCFFDKCNWGAGTPALKILLRLKSVFVQKTWGLLKAGQNT